jgi:hypothetical protein
VRVHQTAAAHFDATGRLARQRRLQLKNGSNQLTRKEQGDNGEITVSEQKFRLDFISPPTISLETKAFCHVNALLEACNATELELSSSAVPHAPSSNQTMASFGNEDSFAPSVFRDTDAKHLHVLHRQQQQQQQQQHKHLRHPILHPLFTSSLLSRPPYHPVASAADIVAQTSSRISPHIQHNYFTPCIELHHACRLHAQQHYYPVAIPNAIISPHLIHSSQIIGAATSTGTVFSFPIVCRGHFTVGRPILLR